MYSAGTGVGETQFPGLVGKGELTGLHQRVVRDGLWIGCAHPL